MYQKLPVKRDMIEKILIISCVSKIHTVYKDMIEHFTNSIKDMSEVFLHINVTVAHDNTIKNVLPSTLVKCVLCTPYS